MSSPPAPSPIDRDHLDRLTLSDRGLEREVLILFRDQSALLVQRLRSRPGDFASDFTALVHTLKGSARAIGAFEVARAAEILEAEAANERQDTPGNQRALGHLEDAIADATRAISEILGGG